MRIIFISLYLLCVFAHATEQLTQPSKKLLCSIDALSQHCLQDLNQSLPDSLYVNAIDYEIDPACIMEELTDITDLHEQKLTTKKDISNALFYLQKMGVFKSIVLKIYTLPATITTDENIQTTPYEFEFQLQKHAIFSQLTISGPLRSKDRYKNAYLIDIGDIFDKQKHEHSLQAIHTILKHHGYFNAQLSDNVIYNKQNASVDVHLLLKKGKRFVIDNITSTACPSSHVSQADCQKMCQKITDACSAKLHNKYYSTELIKNIRHKIKALLEQKGFMIFNVDIHETVQVEKQTIDLDFKITVDRKKEFVFLGNSFFKHQDILNHLLLYGKSAWHFPSSVIADEIIQLYKNKGFWDATVTIREEKDKVFCLIAEGSRAIISSIHIYDNDTLPINPLIKNNFSQLLKTKFFDKELLKKSTEMLLKAYKQSGYWDVKIIKEQCLKTHGLKAYENKNASCKSCYKLLLQIEPGHKRIIGNVTIPNYSDIQEPFTLCYKDRLMQGFDSSLLLEQKQWINRYLRNQGYQKLSIDYELHENKNAQTISGQHPKETIKIIDVTWNISLHESEVKFGKTIIIGNNMVPYNSIMKEVCYNPGENWDKQKIEQTLKNLKELNIFQSIQLYPGQDTDEFLNKPLFMKLVHDDRYEVRTRFGLQQVGNNLQLKRGFTYKVGGSFYLKNLFNVADQGFLEADVTKFYRNITACYQFPWLFGKRIRCQFKIYDSLYEQPVYIGSKNSLYTATQQGFLWNMSHAFPSWTVSGSTGIEFMGIKQADQPQLGSIIDYDPCLLDKKPAYLFLEPNIIWQKVDNLLNPNKGHLSFISCKGMLDLDSKTSFFKLLIEHSEYFPLAQHFTLALRLRGGHVFNRHFDQLIPIERFYLGGASSLRAYQRDYCPPLGKLTEPIYDQHAGLPPQAHNLWRYAPQGGRTMVNFNVELRLPIYHNLGGAVFIDSGALFKNSVYVECQKPSDHFFAGSGFGIRYDTPIGPLRFDCSFKWKRQYPDFESWCVWYVTLGQAF